MNTAPINHRDPIEYLINAMERAGQEDSYGEKRRAVLAAIAALRAERDTAHAQVTRLTSELAFVRNEAEGCNAAWAFALERAEAERDAALAEVRRLQQQVENIAAVNDAVGRERDTAFGVRDAALDREAQAKFAIDEIGQRYLDERAAHNSTILTAIAERDAALAERDALRDAICPDWRAKAFAPSRLPNLARAFRSDSETMDEIGEDFDVSYRTAVSERDALTAVLTEARRVLREVEWSASSAEESECPVCRYYKYEGIHAHDCALAAVLAQEEK